MLLKEIKKGETGTGYLLEKDAGFKEWIVPMRIFSYPKCNRLWIAVMAVPAVVCVMNVTKIMYLLSTWTT